MAINEAVFLELDEYLFHNPGLAGLAVLAKTFYDPKDDDILSQTIIAILSRQDVNEYLADKSIDSFTSILKSFLLYAQGKEHKTVIEEDKTLYQPCLEQLRLALLNSHMPQQFMAHLDNAENLGSLSYDIKTQLLIKFIKLSLFILSKKRSC